MEVMRTKIYEFKMSVENLMDYVLDEQIRKVYDVNPETNAAQVYSLSMTEDDEHWFRKYLIVCLGEICTKLQPLQRYLEEPYQVDELMVTLRFRLAELYQTLLLENLIQEAIGNYVCYRWFSMKNQGEISVFYKSLYDENLGDLRSIGVRGITGRSTAMRSYDMGLGAHVPQPYHEADIVIRDIKWKTKNSHFPKPGAGVAQLPGLTLVGPRAIDIRNGGEIPDEAGEDFRMEVRRSVPVHEELSRPFNETKE